MAIDKLMSAKLVTVALDDTLAEIKEIFDNAKFHHLLVVEDGFLKGVISDRDLLCSISPYVGTASETSRDVATLNKRAHQIMTRNPHCLAPTASLAEALHLFNTHPISCIPIVDDEGTALGILSWRDIMKALGQRL